MRFLKTNKETISEMVVIGNWAKSCKTKEQLDTVSTFFEKYLNKYSFFKYGADKVLLNQGMVLGIILTLSKTRFGKSK